LRVASGSESHSDRRSPLRGDSGRSGLREARRAPQRARAVPNPSANPSRRHDSEPNGLREAPRRVPRGTSGSESLSNHTTLLRSGFRPQRDSGSASTRSRSSPAVPNPTRGSTPGAAKAASTPSISLPVDLSSIGSVTERRDPQRFQ
jgi:hypothetical protein